MKNNELLYLCIEQIKHLADTIKKMDSAGVFEHPMISTTNTLHLIKMAMEENLEQELVTRLYNLVNDAETALGFLRENTPNRNAFSRTEDYREACGDHDTALRALEFRVTEARETLKKVIQ